MRSGITAGLSPQQLLDRRRAQNKLAQRRFREKAKQIRTPGNSVPAPTESTSLSGSSASSPHSSPVAQSSNLHTARSSPQISDSDRAPDSDGAFHQASENVVPQLSVPEKSQRAAGLTLPDDPSSLLNRLMTSQEPTYASLASTSQDICSPPVASGLRGDPFLTSLPLPSPSLLSDASYRMFASPSFQPTFDFNLSLSYRPPVVTPTTAVPNGLGLNKLGNDLYDRRSSLSFEQFLRSQTPASLKPDSSEASSYFSDISTSVTPPLSATLSDSSQEQSTHSPEQRSVPKAAVPDEIDERQQRKPIDETGSCYPVIMLSSMPYSNALHIMLSKSGTLPPATYDRTADTVAKKLALWQHLRAPSPVVRAPSDCAPDQSSVWTHMPENMRPTQEQHVYSHRRCIDFGLPWPSLRSRLLKLSRTDQLCLDEFLLDILLSLVLPEQYPSFFVYGDDPYDPECWELSQNFATKWSGLFDQSILQRSNWWRRQRGLSAHSLPEHADNVSEFVRQRLGTGSVDESGRIWSAAFPSLPLNAHL